MQSLSVVIPVYNEAAVIEGVVRKVHDEIVRKYPKSELIVAEDGSTDGTKDILNNLRKELKFRLFTGNEKKGYFKALKDALKLAKNDVVFYMDSDDTLDPRDFWKLMKYSDYDIVTGSRTSRKDRWLRKFISGFYNGVIGMLFGLKIKDTNVGFKVVKKDVLDEILNDVKYVKYGFSSELLIRAFYKNKKIKEVSINHYDRRAGKAEDFQISRLPRVIYRQFAALLKLRSEIGSKPQSVEAL